MPTALTILSDEHQNILKFIDGLLKECDSMQAGGEVNKNFFADAVDFIKGYADKFHHAKEENILFVELGKDEAQMHCNPMEQMLYEHDLGRNFIKELEKGLEENNKNKIIENAQEYGRLLRDHIFKEDNILYPMADEALKPEVKDNMLEKFMQIEQEMGKAKEGYLLFLSNL